METLNCRPEEVAFELGSQGSGATNQVKRLGAGRGGAGERQGDAQAMRLSLLTHYIRNHKRTLILSNPATQVKCDLRASHLRSLLQDAGPPQRGPPELPDTFPHSTTWLPGAGPCWVQVEGGKQEETMGPQPPTASAASRTIGVERNRGWKEIAHSCASP